MAEFYVHNSLNPNKTVKFNITLRYFVIKGERGDHKWVLEIGTTHLDADDNDISAAKIHGISVDNLDEVIEDALAGLCAQIDWSPLVDDKDAPYVDSAGPTGSDTSIWSNILIVLKDQLPSSGIDLSAMKIILNNDTQDFDITSEVDITGDPYIYTLRWFPPARIFNRYN